MITLDKLTVQVGPKLFTQKSKILLKIQSQTTIIKTNNYAKISTPTSLQWQQSIELPAVYGQQMPFQIYQKHQFGYNPEQIEKVLYGVITFVQGNLKYNNWEIFNSNNKKIGFLSVNIKNRPSGTFEKSQSKSKINNTYNNTSASPAKKHVDNTQIIIISSIVVNLPSIKAKRAYAIINIGGQQIKTANSKSKSGQLVFVERYELQKKQQINQGIIDIYSTATDETDKKIATSIVQLQKRINRKLKFCDNQGNQIGEGFIDGKLELKSQALAEKIFSSMIKQSFKKDRQKGTYTNTFRDMTRSVLDNKSFIRSKMDQSLDLSSSRSRMSIINHNTNIKIPQQKRFFSTRDPANNKCSYLPEQSFQFKQKNVDKYYKGAYIGYGNKADFTEAKKGLPSVGKYKLPSIWDRY